jgi:CBS domain containing-hemolysin-like protein
MKFFYYLFYPGLVVFNGTANAFTSLLGVPPASETEETLEEREIRRVLARSSEAGNVDTTEVEMIERVFDLDDTVVREVMVPGPDVVSVPGDASLSMVRATVLDAGHTRYPVVDADDPDDVVGFIDVKDLVRAAESDDGSETAADIAREVLIVPESTTVSDLLVAFREERQQMAVVIDEWGAFEGIATVEDVIEAVVGDLRDEFDTVEGEPSIRSREDGALDVDGGVPLSAVNDAVDAGFESEEFDTMGGLVLDRLGEVPEPGEEVKAAGYVITVTAVEGSRISSVRIREDDAESDDA